MKDFRAWKGCSSAIAIVMCRFPALMSAKYTHRLKVFAIKLQMSKTILPPRHHCQTRFEIIIIWSFAWCPAEIIVARTSGSFQACSDDRGRKSSLAACTKVLFGRLIPDRFQCLGSASENL